jgi:hypothetical protein
LTRKKLELTRLPHEILLPPAREWENGTPKSEIEPLIDYWYVSQISLFLVKTRHERRLREVLRGFWLTRMQKRLEAYSWRTQETHLNTTLPQFRTAIKVGETGSALRIHFLHIRSSHANAIPLLLIPSFPFTNLSLRPTLWKPLLEPSEDWRAFHIVVPSIPGLGFSDAFTTTGNLLAETAQIFDVVMKRLGYEFYLASSTGSGVDSPAQIDYHLARLLGENFSGSCLGVNLLAPPLQAPSLGSETWGWMKFGLAQFFHANIFGYKAEDFSALRESKKALRRQKGRWRSEEDVPALARANGTGYGAVGTLGLREPNTLAYAFCDSPVGLLSLLTSALRKRSPGHGLSKEEVIELSQLAWLPGPEAGMRFWAGAVSEVEDMRLVKRGPKARVAVTVFGVDGDGEDGYICPAWGEGQHEIVFSQRVNGRPRLVAWERGDVVIEGVRGLATAVAKLDSRLRIEDLEEVVISGDAAEAILEEVEPEPEVGDEHGMQVEVESPDTVVAVEFS